MGVANVNSSGFYPISLLKPMTMKEIERFSSLNFDSMIKYCELVMLTNHLLVEHVYDLRLFSISKKIIFPCCYSNISNYLSKVFGFLPLVSLARPFGTTSLLKTKGLQFRIFRIFRFTYA